MSELDSCPNWTLGRIFVRKISDSCPNLTDVRIGLMSELSLKRILNYNEHIIKNILYKEEVYIISIIHTKFHTNIQLSMVKFPIADKNSKASV